MYKNNDIAQLSASPHRIAEVIPRITQAITEGFDATIGIIRDFAPGEVLLALAENTRVPPQKWAAYPVCVFTRTSYGTMAEGTYLSSLIEVYTNITQYELYYSMLHDDTSRQVFSNLVLYRIYPFNDLIKAAYDANNPQYFDKSIISTDENEVFVDVGGYNGDTVLSYLKHCEKYKCIYTYEPSERLMADCRKNLAHYKNIVFRQVGVGEKSGEVPFFDGYHMIRSDETRKQVPIVSLDDDIKEPTSFIKMDIEGSEINAILGASEHIKNYKPKLSLSVYHFDTDFWKIPHLVHSLNPNYRFYLGHPE